MKNESPLLAVYLESNAAKNAANRGLCHFIFTWLLLYWSSYLYLLLQCERLLKLRFFYKEMLKMKPVSKSLGRSAAIALSASLVALSAYADTPATSVMPPKSHDQFRFDSAVTVAEWSPTDDRVMGGISQSRMRHDPLGHAVFEGNMSLARNGGFASVRASAAAPPLTVTHYILEVRGDGKRYMLNMRTSGRFDGVSYQASFDTTAGTWITVSLPVNVFMPTFRGQRVSNAPPLDPAIVRQLGLMISDKQEGKFQLDVRRISVSGR